MPSNPVVFTTQTAYPLPTQKFMIPTTWKRYQLSQLINKALSLPKPVPFDFLIRGEVLRGTLAEWSVESGSGEEETLEIEYIESVMPPEKMSDIPHEDWVSSVSCQIPGHFLTASYDGSIRAFDYSQTLRSSIVAHQAPITYIVVVPSSQATETSCLVASASQDLTAALTRLSFPANGTDATSTASEVLATLHLHTGPVSSIASSSDGAHLLTASWDGLIGFWDTVIPTADEVPVELTTERQNNLNGGQPKKRRKTTADEDRPKRKAPLSVLKSHTARVSKVVFGKEPDTAYSCGFDSTVRTWNVEHGVCTGTINASAKPFTDLVLTANGSAALAASTDRTVSMYDLRASTAVVNAAVSSLPHASTPSCIAVSATGSEHQVVTGAYDGVVRLWDLRSTKNAMTSFKAWDNVNGNPQKVLSVDWAGGVVGVGGEGGLEIWRVGDIAA